MSRQYCSVRPLPGSLVKSVGRGTAGLAPAGALVVGVDDLVDARRDLALVRPRQRGRIDRLRALGRVDRELAERRRADARIGREAELVVIGDQHRGLHFRFRHGLAVDDGLLELPAAGQRVVVLLDELRLVGRLRECCWRYANARHRREGGDRAHGKGVPRMCRADRHLEPGFKNGRLPEPSGASAWGRTPAHLGQKRPRYESIGSKSIWPTRTPQGTWKAPPNDPRP